MKMPNVFLKFFVELLAISCNNKIFLSTNCVLKAECQKKAAFLT